jgi:hypothetical protein
MIPIHWKPFYSTQMRYIRQWRRGDYNVRAGCQYFHLSSPADIDKLLAKYKQL